MMFRKVKKYLSTRLKRQEKTKHEQQEKSEETYKFSKEIDINLINLKKTLGKSDDIAFREFEIFAHKQLKVFLCFVNGMVNSDLINLHIVKPLMEMHLNDSKKNEAALNIIKFMKDHTLSVAELKETSSMKSVIEAVLSGETVLFVGGYNTALTISTQGSESRSVQEPVTEAAVRGPREGFNENIQVNTALIRRKIKNPNLTFEKFTIGKETSTSIFIGYIDGIANPKIVQEVKNRLHQIDTAAVLESGYIEQYIEDAPFSPFPTIGNSEKPDNVAGKLLEGRVAILCDGTPFVLTVPYLFIENLQSSEDYYSRVFLASFNRLLRLGAFYVTIITPALYVAVSSFHHGMIPTILLITMEASHEGVPFTAALEAIFMGITFELLREAGVRMPRPIGQAISIVGALVIGEAAVQAGIVSSPMIIVMAFTGISGFISPALNDVNIFLRFSFVLLASSLGLYGILIGFLLLFTHMCALRSFGAPYFAPFAPVVFKELKDSVIRAPLWRMNTKPRSVTWQHRSLVNNDQDGEDR